MNGLLPRADMLCVLRYEPDVDLYVGKGVMEGEGHEDSDRERGEQDAGQEEEHVKKAQ